MELVGLQKIRLTKKLKKEDVEKYLSLGWVLGNISKNPLKISDELILEIQTLYKELKSCIKVSKKLNISKTTVLKYYKR